MTKIVVAIALLALLPSTGFACSLSMSPEFHLRGTKHTSLQPPRIGVRNVRFVPWIADSGSCDGVGFIAIELSGLPTRKIKHYGFFVEFLSGDNGKGLFPAFPLAAARTGRTTATISWAWTSITPDPDGHARWTLEITPVSRSRVLGTPVIICAASDGSCPKLDGGGHGD